MVGQLGEQVCKSSRFYLSRSDLTLSLSLLILVLGCGFSSVAAAACLNERLTKAICWVDSSDLAKAKADPNYKRVCHDGGRQRFAERIIGICGQLPPLFQDLMSNVDTIHIERDLDTVAYATATLSRGIVGIQQEVLENEVSFESLLSWKEQLIFRKGTRRFQFNPTLPRYQIVGSDLPNAGLLYVLIHEFAHVLDYRNGVNASWSAAEWEGARYRSTDGTKSMKTYLGSISFYGSTSAIYPVFAEPLYRSLLESTFISTYASTDPHEDFAESVAHYVFLTHYAQNIRLSLNSIELLDSRKRLMSDAFGPKFDFVERFLRRTDLKLHP